MPFVNELVVVTGIETGSILFSGYDMGGRGSIVHQRETADTHCLVVKFPSGKHFAGRGEQAYHPPSIYVLEKQRVQARFRVVCYWECARKISTSNAAQREKQRNSPAAEHQPDGKARAARLR